MWFLWRWYLEFVLWCFKEIGISEKCWSLKQVKLNETAKLILTCQTPSHTWKLWSRMKRLSEAIITSCLTWPFKQPTLQLGFLLHMSAYSIQLNQQMTKNQIYMLLLCWILRTYLKLNLCFMALRNQDLSTFSPKYLSFFFWKGWLKSRTMCPCGKELILDWNV